MANTETQQIHQKQHKRAQVVGRHNKTTETIINMQQQNRKIEKSRKMENVNLDCQDFRILNLFKFSKCSLFFKFIICNDI